MRKSGGGGGGGGDRSYIICLSFGIYLESLVEVKTKLALLTMLSEECLVAKATESMGNHNT